MRGYFGWDPYLSDVYLGGGAAEILGNNSFILRELLPLFAPTIALIQQNVA